MQLISWLSLHMQGILTHDQECITGSWNNNSRPSHLSQDNSNLCWLRNRGKFVHERTFASCPCDLFRSVYTSSTSNYIIDVYKGRLNIYQVCAFINYTARLIPEFFMTICVCRWKTAQMTWGVDKHTPSHVVTNAVIRRHIRCDTSSLALSHVATYAVIYVATYVPNVVTYAVTRRHATTRRLIREYNNFMHTRT